MALTNEDVDENRGQLPNVTTRCATFNGRGQLPSLMVPKVQVITQLTHHKHSDGKRPAWK
jgi:hypothetical protein